MEKTILRILCSRAFSHSQGGHFRTSARPELMSALLRRTDLVLRDHRVRKVPISKMPDATLRRRQKYGANLAFNPADEERTYGCERHGMGGKGVTAFLAGRGAKYRRARASAMSHRTDAKTDPRTQLAGSPIGWRQAWTAFRAAASRQNGPPVQYQRQRQLSQLQQDIRSSWRWFLHRPHGLPDTL